jgi:hypothetical protein
MNACAIPEAACGPASTPVPAAIVEKIAVQHSSIQRWGLAR